MSVGHITHLVCLTVTVKRVLTVVRDRCEAQEVSLRQGLTCTQLVFLLTTDLILSRGPHGCYGCILSYSGRLAPAVQLE